MLCSCLLNDNLFEDLTYLFELSTYVGGYEQADMVYGPAEVRRGHQIAGVGVTGGCVPEGAGNQT